MQELIKIQNRAIGSDTINAVNGRELWEFLEVKERFRQWIAEQIEAFGFVENVDFGISQEKPQISRPGPWVKEYLLSIPMAKELSMLSRTAKGKEARLYFLECEKRALGASDPMAILNDPVALRGMLVTYSEKVMVLQPKADALDRIATADGSLCITDAAKALQTTPRTLAAWMGANAWVYRRKGSGPWVGYQVRLDSGDLETKTVTITDKDGVDHVARQTRITPKGLAELAKKKIAA